MNLLNISSMLERTPFGVREIEARVEVIDDARLELDTDVAVGNRVVGGGALVERSLDGGLGGPPGGGGVPGAGAAGCCPAGRDLRCAVAVTSL